MKYAGSWARFWWSDREESAGYLIGTARRRMWLFLAYFAANIGPEFLDDIGEHVVPDL